MSVAANISTNIYAKLLAGSMDNSAPPRSAREKTLEKQLMALRQELMMTKMDLDEATVQNKRLTSEKNDTESLNSQLSSELAHVNITLKDLMDAQQTTNATQAKVQIAHKKSIRLARQSQVLNRKNQEEIKDLKAENKGVNEILDSLIQLNIRTTKSRSTNLKIQMDDHSTNQKGNVYLSIWNKMISRLKTDWRQIKNTSKVINYLSHLIKTEKANKRLTTVTEKLKWVKLSNCTPLRNGMYYVSDGQTCEIAMYSSQSQSFKRTSSNMPIEYWCYNSNSVDLTPLALEENW